MTSGSGPPLGERSTFPGRTLVPGVARGPAVVLDEPLSLWGGMDPASGRIVDGRHPQAGSSLAGSILVMPSGRGSSSSSSVLAEALRRGRGPLAIVLGEADIILALGSLVAGELYGRSCPVVVSPAAWRGAATGDPLDIRAGPEEAVIRRGP